MHVHALDIYYNACAYNDYTVWHVYYCTIMEVLSCLALEIEVFGNVKAGNAIAQQGNTHIDSYQIAITLLFA